MSRPPPIPEPLDCVLFDAGDTLLSPAPSFQGRFVAVAAANGLPLADPGATLHVGDQPANDVDAARAAGITPVLIDRFARYPRPNGTHRIESLLGLVELVSGNGSG